MRRQDNTPIKRISNNLHSYSTLSEVGHDSPPLMCKMCIVTTFQLGWYSNRGDTWRYAPVSIVEEPDHPCLSRMIKVNTSKDKSG